MNTSPFKLALVTGASGGIGKALSRLLAKQNIPLILHGRNQNSLEKLASELQVPTEIVLSDLSTEVQRKPLVQKIRERVPDLIINNAGIGIYGEVISQPTAAQLNIIKVNNEALVEIAIEGAKALSTNNRQGIILNVSSALAFLLFPEFAVYSASKAFINSFSQSLDLEMTPYGIRVLAACPGRVATDFSAHAGGKGGKQGKEFITADFAAEQIWAQIQSKTPVSVFDWKYRWGIRLCNLFSARYIVGRMLQKGLQSIKKK